MLSARKGTVALAALALAGCFETGGSDDSATGGATPPASGGGSTTPQPVSDLDAFRFSQQATFGSSPSDIEVHTAASVSRHLQD